MDPSASGLIAVIVVSRGLGGIRLYGQRPARPVAGSFHRSKVDAAGHTRGIVQVDLMRRIMADRARSVPPADVRRTSTRHRVPSQAHPLLGRPAPAFVLRDADGRPGTCAARSRDGPVVVVFYLGSTCVACVTHLVELDAAMPRFRERGARVWAISADRPRVLAGRMPPVRRSSDPALERPGPRGLHGLRRLETDPGRRPGRRRGPARDLHRRPRRLDPLGLPRRSPVHGCRGAGDRARSVEGCVIDRSVDQKNRDVRIMAITI